LSRQSPCGCSAVGSRRSIGIDSIVARASLKSFRFAPDGATPSGMPWPSVRTLRFAPFCSIGGIRPCLVAAQRCLPERAVHRQPLPCDPDLAVVGQQPAPPELQEQPRLGPLAEAAVGGRATADPGRVERVPLHPRPQHEQDRVHRIAVGHTRVVTAERMRRPLRQQRLHLRPHLVRNPPTVIFDHEPHQIPPSSDDEEALRPQSSGPLPIEIGSYATSEFGWLGSVVDIARAGQLSVGVGVAWRAHSSRTSKLGRPSGRRRSTCSRAWPEFRWRLHQGAGSPGTTHDAPADVRRD
jgi:hypothetical protein